MNSLPCSDISISGLLISSILLLSMLHSLAFFLRILVFSMFSSTIFSFLRRIIVLPISLMMVSFNRSHFLSRTAFLAGNITIFSRMNRLFNSSKGSYKFFAGCLNYCWRVDYTRPNLTSISVIRVLIGGYPGHLLLNQSLDDSALLMTYSVYARIIDYCLSDF
jgi:hypothetical protein